MKRFENLNRLKQLLVFALILFASYQSMAQTVIEAGADVKMAIKEKGADITLGVSFDVLTFGYNDNNQIRVGGVLEHYGKRKFFSRFFTVAYGRNFTDKLEGEIGGMVGGITRYEQTLYPNTSSDRKGSLNSTNLGVFGTLRYFPEKWNGFGFGATLTNTERHDLSQIEGTTVNVDNNRWNGYVKIVYKFN